MSGIKHLYTFKCQKGHVIVKMFPPGTRLDEHDEETCAECLKANELKTAYVIYVEPKPHG
jgi:hypothetical protein